MTETERQLTEALNASREQAAEMHEALINRDAEIAALRGMVLNLADALEAHDPASIDLALVSEGRKLVSK